MFSQSTINSRPQRALAICKPVERLIFYVRVLWQTVLYVDHNGACLPTGQGRLIVKIAKGDDLKQIVELPALNSTESWVAVSSLYETMTETMVRTPTASISRCQRD